MQGARVAEDNGGISENNNCLVGPTFTGANDIIWEVILTGIDVSYERQLFLTMGVTVA
jgi:hypothetical protein